MSDIEKMLEQARRYAVEAAHGYDCSQVVFETLIFILERMMPEKPGLTADEMMFTSDERKEMGR